MVNALHEARVAADRDLPPAEALARLPELCARFAVTRIGDTTRLNRIGLPTMCAVVPDSLSDVSIYNGRGESKDQAALGAVMEAVERQTAARCAIPETIAAPHAVRNTIDLQRCGLRDEYARTPMPFVQALDILSGRTLAVPKALVQTPWRGLPAFQSTHTNGLASGFSLREAIYHALLELVERHLYAVTHARAHLRPKRLLQHIFGAGPLSFVDDPVDEIVQPTRVRSIDSVCERFSQAGTEVRLVAMRVPPFPLGVLASVCDRERTDFHAGFGCSRSPVTAVLRALSEAAQACTANIQAARENILRAGDPPSRFATHTRRRTS
ncbi:MAG TPA: YcaO-like family protein, partial [Candidatus Baltobacteraceae bacterium]